MSCCSNSDFYVSLLWSCGIMARMWNGEMMKWLGTVLWWNKYGKTTQRIHTHVHMVQWWDGEMDWYIAMLKRIWWNGAQNIHPCLHVEMVKLCGAKNTKMKQCNGETIIPTFNRFWFIGPIPRWGPILILHLIRICITYWWKFCLWMIPRWSSKWPMSRYNAVWCRIHLFSSDQFILFILLFIPTTTTNSGGFAPFFTFLYLSIYWCTCTGNITSCQYLLYYRTKNTLHMEVVVNT